MERYKFVLFDRAEPQKQIELVVIFVGVVRPLS